MQNFQDHQQYWSQQELHNALMRAGMVGQLSAEQSSALEAAALAGDKLAKVATKLARRRCRRPAGREQQRPLELMQLTP